VGKWVPKIDNEMLRLVYSKCAGDSLYQANLVAGSASLLSFMLFELG
jgi:hypothetical protein